jgi:8-oxo-dGTP pyrophosphatase MutT (NUDIX family)
MEIAPKNNFVIRVYGIALNGNNEVLISDEYMLDTKMIKFPGGGLEYGEGPVDCLKREAIEEFGQEVEVTGHFYTTDYFQPALYYKDTQLISIYYFIRFKDPIQFKIASNPFDFKELKNGNQSFRWVSLGELDPADLTFPIDRKVARALKEKFNR